MNEPCPTCGSREACEHRALRYQTPPHTRKAEPITARTAKAQAFQGQANREDGRPWATLLPVGDVLALVITDPAWAAEHTDKLYAAVRWAAAANTGG